MFGNNSGECDECPALRRQVLAWMGIIFIGALIGAGMFFGLSK